MGLNIALPTAPVVAPAAMRQDTESASPKVPESTMAQRLVRAKRKIRDAGIPYRVPPDDQLGERLSGVLAVVYLVFNEAYLSRRPDGPLRVDLAEEAIRLGRELYELMPDEPEVGGLLSLMLVQHARAAARFDDAGDLVLLPAQDRSSWDRGLIDEGSCLLERSMRRRSVGPYQLQAAIAALHSEAASYEATDWPQIVALYDKLAEYDPSPIVVINKAVALCYRGDPAQARGLLEDLGELVQLRDYQSLYAARAYVLERCGDRAGARKAYLRAIELAPSNAQKAYLQKRLKGLQDEVQ